MHMDIYWTVSGTCTCTDACYLTFNFLAKSILLDIVRQSDVKSDEHHPKLGSLNFPGQCPTDGSDIFQMDLNIHVSLDSIQQSG